MHMPTFSSSSLRRTLSSPIPQPTKKRTESTTPDPENTAPKINPTERQNQLHLSRRARALFERLTNSRPSPQRSRVDQPSPTSDATTSKPAPAQAQAKNQHGEVLHQERTGTHLGGTVTAIRPDGHPTQLEVDFLYREDNSGEQEVSFTRRRLNSSDTDAGIVAYDLTLSQEGIVCSQPGIMNYRGKLELPEGAQRVFLHRNDNIGLTRTPDGALRPHLARMSVFELPDSPPTRR